MVSVYGHRMRGGHKQMLLPTDDTFRGSDDAKFWVNCVARKQNDLAIVIIFEVAIVPEEGRITSFLF